MVRGGQVFSAEVFIEVGQNCWADLVLYRPLSLSTRRWTDLDTLISLSLKMVVGITRTATNELR